MDDSECEEGVDSSERDFFNARSYASKNDIIAAVVAYNTSCQRSFVIVSSDTRRYRVKCTEESCAFVVNFAFSRVFKPPTLFTPHSCSISSVDQMSHAANRHKKAKQLAQNKVSRELFADEGRDVTPKVIQQKLRVSVKEYQYTRTLLMRFFNTPECGQWTTGFRC